MDIRTLKNFMKIAEYGSICRAAEHLHIAQPPLSRQLKVLEEELGTKLFERSSKGVKLTEKGQLLYNRAASLISYNDLIIRELTSDANIIRLGVTTSLVEYSLSYIKRYNEDNPTHFEITEKNTFELLELLKNTMLDIIFIRTPFETSNHFTYIKLGEDFLIAVGNPDFFQSNMGDSISVRDLHGVPIITVRRWKSFIDIAASTDQHTHLDYRFICDDNRTAFSLAANGMGVAIIPGCIMDSTLSDSLVIKEIRNNESLKTNIYMVFTSAEEQKPSVDNFISFVTQQP